MTNYTNCLVITSLPNENDKIDGDTNKPKIRHKNILETIRDKYDFFIPKNCLNSTLLKDLGVHSDDYVDFLESAWISFKENYDKDYDPKCDGGLVPYHFCPDRQSLSYKKIPHLWKRVGYFCQDVSTPIYESTYRIAMISANNSYTAARQIENYNLIYCLNPYPSHHVGYDFYGGYCYLNNVAICAKHYQKLNKGAKVAILDLDLHAHNGTQDIFYEDNTVYTISIHSDPVFEYPSYSGFDDEHGKGSGLGCNANIIFGKDVKSEEYLKLVNDAINLINDFDPQLVIVAFGGDTYKDDKDASELYSAKLELEDYTDIGKELKKLNKKIVITQEGGYCMDKIGLIVDNLLKGLVDV